MRAPAPLTLRGTDTRSSAHVAGLRLRSASPLRSAPLPTIAVVIVFCSAGQKKGTKIKDCPILIRVESNLTENFLNVHAYTYYGYLVVVER